MEKVDVIIVGGGPAGSTCAGRLVAAGLDVLVLDRKPFPRDKVCAGWITPAVVAALGLDLDDYRKENVLQPIRAFRTGLMGERAVVTAYSEPVSYGIRRSEFDSHLLFSSGARLVLGEGVSQIGRVGRMWQVNGRWSAPLLIGAGGHYCPVARHLGSELGRGENPVAAQEVEFALEERQLAQCAVSELVPEIYFTPDLKGYGWCVRKGGWLNVGLGIEGAIHLGHRVREFVALLQSQGRLPAELPERLHGHAYLLHRRPAPRRRLADGVLLVGDAAGLAYPRSGEGIRPAVESALLAARTIVEARGDYRESRLAPYARRLDRRLGRGASPLPGPFGRWLAPRLLASPRFTRHVLLDRWFLHRHQPALDGLSA